MTAGYDGMRIEDFRPGMIFIDSANTTKRIVVLGANTHTLDVWICTVGGRGPRRASTQQFYWGPLTPHKKVRRTGCFLDTTIPGNTRENWQRG